MSCLSRVSLLQTQIYFKAIFVSQPIIKLMLQKAYRTTLPKCAPLISNSIFFKSNDTTDYFTTNESSKSSFKKICDPEVVERIEKISESNEFLFNTPMKTGEFFTTEDDQLIVSAVNLHGDEKNTFVKIAKALDIPDPTTIENRYRNYLINLDLNELEPSDEKVHKIKRRSFEKEDDEVILNHINRYGKSEISMKVLAKTLNRGSWRAVRNRAEKLPSTSPKEEKPTKVKLIRKTEDSNLRSFTFEKPSQRKGQFSSQEDIIILNHIDKFGDSKISLTRLAEELNRKSMTSLIKRIHHLKSKESEEEILSGALGEENDLKSGLKSLSFEKQIEKRVENGSKKRMRKKKIFSREEDDIIIQAVEQHGDNKKTFIGVSKILSDKPDPRTVETQYRGLQTSGTTVKGRFSPEEDQIMLQHIAEYGQGENSLKHVAQILNRKSWKSIESRINLLKSTNEYDKGSKVKGEWTLEEERKMIQNVLSLPGVESHDIAAFESVIPSQFSEFGKDCKRSSRGCYMRWNTVLLPAIKTYILGLPRDDKWKLDLMLYIVKHKVKSLKDLELDMLVKEVAPGQTIKSILVFLESIKLTHSIDKSKSIKVDDIPLYELAAEKLNKKSSRNPLFNNNHKGEKRRLERMNAIIDIYRNSTEL